jgi:hypothetical protein
MLSTDSVYWFVQTSKEKKNLWKHVDNKCYNYSHFTTSFASKEIGLELNAEKYMIITRDRNAGRSNDINIDNSSFERVEQFRYCGTNLTHQGSIQEEIKSRFKSGSACYHSMQNLLSSNLLSQNMKIKFTEL